jgi:radical SAM protein with 4Fe4S-binding SPASM domain
VVPDIELGVEWDEQRVEQAYVELGEHYAWRRTPSRYINDLVDAIAQGKPKPGNPCNFGRGTWTVMPDGELRACQRGERIGSIYEGVTDARPLYESALCATLVNSRRPLKPECQDCVAFRFCPGVGYCCAANREHGNSAIPTEAHCQHLRGMVRACREWAAKQPTPVSGVLQRDVLGVTYRAIA